MSIKDATNILDDMVSDIEEDWEDENEIQRISDAVNAVKFYVSANKIVGNMELNGKRYVITERRN